MPQYIPIPDRAPYFGSLPKSLETNRVLSPRYASPDLDPNEPYPWTRQGLAMAEEKEEYNQVEDADEYDEGGEASYQVDEGAEEGPSYSDGHAVYDQTQEAGPSRKRSRTEGNDHSNGHHHQSHRNVNMPIIPSIFGISPRNEFTKTIGEFILAHCHGQQHVEIEIKLGTLQSGTKSGDKPRRINLPAMSEMIMPHDFLFGGFVSNMNKAQNVSLNRLLNQATELSQRSPYPIKFYRAQHTDSFHGGSGRDGKVRVSRDRAGRIVENGVIRKRRLGDLNVFSPREAFDWRVSVNVEEPCEMPQNQPSMVRDKDRACYRHQLCQVDLTVVTARPTDGGPNSISYELEIEILDAPALLAEGEKEQRGEPNRLDEILQSCLDTVRMLVRNVG